MGDDRRILFIFPHPDDESYSCGGTLARLVSQGSVEVHLLTYTRGEASRWGREKGMSKAEVGEMRAAEMQRVAAHYGLHGFYQLDFPDGQTSLIDPRPIESAIAERIESLKPQVVVTYATHGISAFPDHIVAHAVVKRVFVALKDSHTWLKRFAQTVVTEAQAEDAVRPLFGAPDTAIDCRYDVRDYIDAKREALLMQKSIAPSVERDMQSSGLLADYEYYDFWGESYQPPVDDLFHDIV